MILPHAAAAGRVRVESIVGIAPGGRRSLARLALRAGRSTGMREGARVAGMLFLKWITSGPAPGTNRPWEPAAWAFAVAVASLLVLVARCLRGRASRAARPARDGRTRDDRDGSARIQGFAEETLVGLLPRPHRPPRGRHDDAPAAVGGVLLVQATSGLSG
ncbi:hypothetical protein OJF2_02770 [Aquisphaera giovannonii]|uniref:Uncharacterized protein n=1 Tax=Aquisphaera giovannonii TaxID=406548 RepID=A0A5B9VU12_9BACT|nr:hypothetical protein [Aquisphaera giovannonii]QEH31812.1 hypothetical protein OJF2_02770 [Aquisphaera giovannonii]